MLKQFGASVTSKNEARYAKSKNWNGKKFVNLEETSLNFSFQDLPKMLYEQFCKKQDRVPSKNLSIAPFDKEAFLAPSTKAKFIWYAHSVILLRINNKTLLIDPMLGPNASPIAPFSTDRFSEKSLDIIDELPEIDLVLFTHDHYDHVDLDSLIKLMPKTKEYYVGLGVGRHLEKWGISADKIKEFDWWDETAFGDINITYTPTRHFSGRGLTDREKSLWGGWVFKTASESIYFSGDGGYGKHFKEIGERLGPFDFGFMECGQYNEKWHLIHMFPEESVQAAIDTHTKKIMPVHWAGFALAMHTWTDPVIRFIETSQKENIPFITPKIGELVSFEDNTYQNNQWWENI
ncbi:MAG: hypothetical protein GY827_02025 [Cytophagales bacterium]|nr:hypothetical protein [Cytophagales bacterium]